MRKITFGVLVFVVFCVSTVRAAIVYAGGTNVSTAIAADTRLLIVDNLKAQLVIAGWTVASGASGDWLLTSASTPTANNSISLRLYDPGSGNCAQAFLRTAAGAKISHAYYLLPGAGKSYKVIANKYQAFVFTLGASAGREFLSFGTLAIPVSLQGVLTNDLGWIWENSCNSDTSTSVCVSFRTDLQAHSSASAVFSAIAVGNLMEQSNTPNSAGHLKMLLPYSSAGAITLVYRWHDDSLVVSDPLMAWGLSATSDEAKVRGQLFDAVVVSASFAGDTTVTIDGKTFWAITNSNTAGTLFVAVCPAGGTSCTL